MPFFSIIIPVYNTQDYIERCLKSCINQSFSDIEIIVVDDCGKDNAMQIVQEYLAIDSRIKIISNPQNLGLFHTRIIGETNAKGEYILHVDSDDFIDLELCKKLHQKISTCNEEIDIVGFGSKIFPKPDSTSMRFFYSPLLENYSQEKVMDLFTCGWNLWGKAYSRKLIQKANQYIFTHFASLPKINMAEDMIKLFVISMYAQKYIHIAEYLYFYFKNPESITREISYDTSKGNMESYNSVIQELEKINLNAILPPPPSSPRVFQYP